MNRKAGTPDLLNRIDSNVLYLAILPVSINLNYLLLFLVVTQQVLQVCLRLCSFLLLETQ